MVKHAIEGLRRTDVQKKNTNIHNLSLSTLVYILEFVEEEICYCDKMEEHFNEM